MVNTENNENQELLNEIKSAFLREADRQRKEQFPVEDVAWENYKWEFLEEIRGFLKDDGIMFFVDYFARVSDEYKKHIIAIYSTNSEYRHVDEALIIASVLGEINLVKKLVENGANIHARGERALIETSYTGHLEVIQHLVEKGADIHTKNEMALCKACYKGHYEIVEYLIQQGAVIPDGLVGVAAEHGHLEVLKLLVKHGADIHTDNDDALYLAAKNDHLDIASLLIELGCGPSNIYNEKSRTAVLEYVHSTPWYDPETLTTYLKNNKSNSDSRNESFIKKVLSSPSKKPKIIINDEAIFDRLEEQFPNFLEVIHFYKSQFRLMEITGKQRITPTLLLGEPGIGKTYFVKKLAEALATGFTLIDMASSSAAFTISGLHASWNGAKQGKLLEAIYTSSTFNPLILLDEIDKSASTEGKDDPKNAIFQVLEDHGAKAFVDEFFDNPIDLSGAIFIASANSLNGLSEPLQSRFKIFDIASPTPEEQRKIFQRIYREEISESEKFAQYLPQEIVEHLLDSSLRIAKQKISDGVGRALLDVPKDRLKSNEEQIDVKLEHFKEHHRQKVKIGF